MGLSAGGVSRQLGIIERLREVLRRDFVVLEQVTNASASNTKERRAAETRQKAEY